MWRSCAAHPWNLVSGTIAAFFSTLTRAFDRHRVSIVLSDSEVNDGGWRLFSNPSADQDLVDRSLLDDTLVVVVGEFGRTPKFENHGKGRGHWPECYTGLLAGGGIRGGAVYGSSDRQGAFVASDRPISHVDFGATLCHALGIPPETRYGLDGFSFRVSEGQPVLELFG